ncbi:sulfite exporter TauE/SafE family protein [Plantibacter sp. CFBP 8804]|uniref:sulfite exporter TauE/SafE family protein n=1 Tax=Plantibacter sp. CFBP 8804 TaxID=2775270 RepID=UPI0017846681|nr:sulfite exporter TauE/SafE family protein [Plantibacter sp. CFBP 8804]MBD8518073.1 sulfite exporter TauE/SafE family protein [Plantibacter sp. CFBP 8804]
MIFGLIAFGLLVGGLTGILGAGGGIIAVPALVYIVGIPLETAISTSLLMGAVGPIAALIPRIRTAVDWRMVGAVAIAGIPMAFIGTAVGSLLPEQVILVVFAALMFASAVQMLRRRPTEAVDDSRPPLWILRGFAVGLLVGFLTGLLGVGGGFITVPALVLALRLPIKKAIGTSLAIAVLNSVAGIVAHVGITRPDWGVALAFGLPAIAASFVTARFAHRISGRVLQTGFAVLLFVVAGLTILQVLTR